MIPSSGFTSKSMEHLLIINLPGSPKAVKESLECIMPALGHGLQILKGSATECARS
jgi:molybdopterin biosynthesis enzyme MoaB